MGRAAVRLNLHLRGIDLVDVELHLGSRGLYVDLNVFQPRAGEVAPTGEPVATTADLSSTTALHTERVEGPVWQDDQPALVKADGFGFQGRQA